MPSARGASESFEREPAREVVLDSGGDTIASISSSFSLPRSDDESTSVSKSFNRVAREPSASE